MSSIQSKILALKVGETVRIESETFGKVQFQVEGTEDNRENGSEGLRVFQAWGDVDGIYILLEAGPDAMDIFIPEVMEVIS